MTPRSALQAALRGRRSSKPASLYHYFITCMCMGEVIETHQSFLACKYAWHGLCGKGLAGLLACR